MSLMRAFFLECSEKRWLKERAIGLWFVRRTVARFMPGETANSALGAAAELRDQSIGSVFTCLGENVKDSDAARAVTNEYLEILDAAALRDIPADVSVKLTHLGLDLGGEICARNLAEIIQHAGLDRVVWIDMESSRYVDRTLEIYRRMRAAFPNVGVCLQAYLYRTAADLAALLPLGPAIRLVKGAYNEPTQCAFPKKKAVDENYFELAKMLLSPEARAAKVRAAIATHDRKLIKRIIDYGENERIDKNVFQFQMLFGIQRKEQLRLAKAGYKMRVLISYGPYWFPWFMRRLAERPANVLFVIRNLV